MSTSRQTDRQPIRSLWLGLGAFLGTFLLIPLWDLFALIYAVLTGWRAHQESDDDQALAVLVQPVRRLAFLGVAYLLALIGAGVLAGMVRQPGPFGFLVTGLNRLPDWAVSNQIVSAANCCDLSLTYAEGRPVTELIGVRLPNSLYLLVATSVAAGLLTALVIAIGLLLRRLIARREQLGLIVQGIVKLAAFRYLAAPALSIGLVAVAFLAIRFKLFPYGGAVSFEPESALLIDRIWHMALPAVIAALLPSLIAGKAGLSAWADWQDSGRPEAGRWAILGLESARAFAEQAGWLIGGLMAVEVIFAYPGVGALLVAAIEAQDTPLLIGVLAVFPLWMLIVRMRAALTASAQRAYELTYPAGAVKSRGKKVGRKLRQDTGSEQKQSVAAIWLGIAGLVIIWLVISNVVGTLRSPYDPQLQTGEAYEMPSETHLKGTDIYGRDIQSRLLQGQRVTFGVALQAGLIALFFGGLWGGVSAMVRRWRGVVGESLADLIRIPADAAILLHPTLVVLAFSVARSARPVVDGTGQSLAAMGYMVGMALVPRMAWAVESLVDNLPEKRPVQWQIVAVVVVVFVGAMFAAWQYTTTISFLTLGVQPPRASLGNNLSNYQELLAGMLAVTDARFYLLMTNMTTAVGMQAFALYLLQDAVIDFFGFRRKTFLARLFT